MELRQGSFARDCAMPLLDRSVLQQRGGHAYAVAVVSFHRLRYRLPV
jgi:hypothetical protein